MKYKKTNPGNLLTMLLVMLSNAAMAQSAYHGGKGDGYASAEIQNVVLGINPGNKAEQNISIYPNPAKTNESLHIIQSDAKPYQVEIMNMLGQVLYTNKYLSKNGTIQLSDFKPGNYLIRINNSEFNYVQKLVIVNP